jgi:hypothetical protein
LPGCNILFFRNIKEKNATMGTTASKGLTGFGVYGLLPAAVSFLVIAAVRKGLDPGVISLMIMTVLIAIGIPCMLTVLIPDVANSLKKDGSNDIDPTTAGTFIVVSLMLSILGSGLAQLWLRKK